MTSVHRQIGIECENLFRRVPMDRLSLKPADVLWAYEVPMPIGKPRVLTLDGRVPLNRIEDTKRRAKFHERMEASAQRVGVEPAMFKSMTGTISKARQCYRSKASKRQNADIANTSTGYAKGYLSCATELSNQMDPDVLLRFRMRNWAVITGVNGPDDPVLSTNDFMHDVVGYDPAAFFERNSATLRAEIDKVLEAPFAPETT